MLATPRLELATLTICTQVGPDIGSAITSAGESHTTPRPADGEEEGLGAGPVDGEGEGVDAGADVAAGVGVEEGGVDGLLGVPATDGAS